MGRVSIARSSGLDERIASAVATSFECSASASRRASSVIRIGVWIAPELRQRRDAVAELSDAPSKAAGRDRYGQEPPALNHGRDAPSVANVLEGIGVEQHEVGDLPGGNTSECVLQATVTPVIAIVCARTGIAKANATK